MVEVRKISGSARSEATFTYAAAPGHSVVLAGVFNDWDSAGTVMDYDAKKSVYRCVLELAPGIYEYKLVVDGEWLLDDSNPNFVSNDFGTLNSVIKVD